MARWPKPAEGSWTEHYPELGTGPVSYEDSISPEFYELERDAIFKRAWLNVGRVEQLPRNGSYFTKELHVANTSIVVVRDMDGQVRAFHNICRHRGNKLVWTDYPGEETNGTCRQFTCKYHGWRYDLDGAFTFVQQESEFFDLDKNDYGLVPVHCDVWEGFIFINLAPRARTVAAGVPRPDDHLARGLPVRPDDRALVLPLRGQGELEALHGRLPGVLPRTGAALGPVTAAARPRRAAGGLRSAALPHRRSPPPGEHGRDPGVGARPTRCASRSTTSVAAGCSGRGTPPTSASRSSRPA